MLRSRSTGCSPVPREARPIRGGGGMRDLSGVIERLRREKAPAQARRRSPTVLQLESVPTSSHAVYQTIKVDQEDSIRTELDEVHRMLNPAETVVGPDGKALTTIKLERQGGSDSGENGEQSISDEAETSIFCEICTAERPSRPCDQLVTFGFSFLVNRQPDVSDAQNARAAHPEASLIVVICIPVPRLFVNLSAGRCSDTSSIQGPQVRRIWNLKTIFAGLLLII